MIKKRGGSGSAIHWLNGRFMALDRYLQRFYDIYDWDNVKRFFFENPIQARTIINDFLKTNEQKQNKVIDILMEGKSKIIYIVGGRGQGKTVLAFWIVEQIHLIDLLYPIYIVGEGIIKQFPAWINCCENIKDVPNGAFVILDEASIRYSAREFYKEANMLLGKLLAIARHKDLSIIFITQHTGLIDINILRLRDIILWKKMNSYSIGERTEKRTDEFWGKVRTKMSPRAREETLFEYPAERRFINFSHSTSDFWNENMSTMFRDYNPIEEAIKNKIRISKEQEARELGFIKKKAEIEADVYAKRGLKQIEKEEYSEGLP